MNKLGMVFGLAAVATLAGCKDPDYKSDRATDVQNEVKDIEVAEPVADPATKPAEPAKPVVTADLSKPADSTAEQETTIYIVQSGDYLAKISKKYNVTINSIKRLNPSIKKDVIFVGQKLKLPGKIDVGVQPAPAKAPAIKDAGAKAPAKKTYVPYTGATKEYVVKNGDTLGSIAYGNGINIRQLKELNGLSSDSLKVGQKLKVPAEKTVAAKKSAPVKDEKVAAAAVAEKTAPTVQETKKAEEAIPEAKTVEKKDDVAAAIEQLEEKKDAAADAKPAAPAASPTTYVVREGDDITGVSISWGVSAAEIRELNNMAEGDQLVPGQIIKLPADAQQ